MYRAFNIATTAQDWGDMIIPETISNKFSEDKDAIMTILQSLAQSLPIDGSKLRNRWFPKIKADIFISHSHQDQVMALKCATWLKHEFGLVAFVDSCVWGSADQLLQTIDNSYCKNEDRDTYSYEKRNETTSHIHMMLATALTEMLDATECIFFMNTPKSILPIDAITKTKSPWLYYELTSINALRRKRPTRLQPLVFTNEGAITAKRTNARFEAEYEVSLEELTTLTADSLNNWQKANSTNTAGASLDLLYKLNPT